MNEKNEVCVSNESRRHPEPSVLLSPYYPLATPLLESTLNLRREVLILNFFLLSIKFSTFQFSTFSKKQLSEIYAHSPFKLIGICAAYRNVLVRAEHLQLIAARMSSRNGLDEIHVNDKGAVACKHTLKAVERLAELFYGYAQRMVAHLAVVQKADVGVVLHRLDVDYFFDAHLKNGIVCISRKRDDVLLRRFAFLRGVDAFEPLLKMRVYGFHRLQLGLQIAVLCSVKLHHEDED